MEIESYTDLPSHSTILTDTPVNQSETAARLALQSAQDKQDKRTGRHLKRFSEQLLKKLALNEHKQSKKVSKIDSNSSIFDPKNPLKDLNEMIEIPNKQIVYQIIHKQKGDEKHETEFNIQAIGQKIKDQEVIGINVLPSKPTSEPEEEKIDSLNWNQLMVEIRSLVFSYSRKHKFLDKVDMSVPKSAIYGLLGPSGCGKTTLLRLILGLIKQKSGSIRVNGKRPGDPKNNIPGTGVGFMPQELAIYQEFSLNESLKYFGRIYGMSNELILSRIKFLCDFLDLPDPERLVKHMSGGQKRRVSLSLSLVHNPPLLILDEPTVGTDPVLRERIWEHLVVLSQNESTTIIITTHYIEEARRAHVVSLMRNGELLVEHSPQFLLRHFSVHNLEDVFLRMCKQDINDKQMIPQNYIDNKNNNSNNISNNNQINENQSIVKQIPTKSVSYIQRVLTQTHKNYIRLIRNKPLLVFQTIMPTICIIIFCLCIGTKPHSLKIAVFNQEYKEGVNNSVDRLVSDSFLDEIDNKTINLKNFNSYESVMDAVRNSDEIYGALIIPEQFSKYLVQRFMEGISAKDETISNSTIQFYGDFTDMIISESITKALIDAEYSFEKDLVKHYLLIETKKNNTKQSRVFDPIVKFEEPVFGSLDPKFRDFITPGIILAVIYLMAVGLTALSIVVERKEGLIERTIVSGVKQHEILAAQVILEFCIVTLQTILLMIFTFLVFQIPNRGNIAFIMILVLFQGLTGMSFGLIISSLCHDENSAIMASLGSFYPYFLLSGVIWPLEGMPYILRQITYFFPQTLPILALRNIMLKGWGLTYPFVYLGFISTIVWMFLFLIIATIIMKYKK